MGALRMAPSLCGSTWAVGTAMRQTSRAKVGSWGSNSGRGDPPAPTPRPPQPQHRTRCPLSEGLPGWEPGKGPGASGPRAASPLG